MIGKKLIIQAALTKGRNLLVLEFWWLDRGEIKLEIKSINTRAFDLPIFPLYLKIRKGPLEASKYNGSILLFDYPDKLLKYFFLISYR